MAENEQVVDPVEQEVVPFHEHEIIAVRLADGRICVVLRWVCETLQLDSQGQVRRIERTASTARELVRVRVQPRVAGSKGGGVQTMPALTLRGFSPWILGINPDEVKSDEPTEEARIRELIVAYQEEAKDVLYLHFLNKGHPVLPESEALHKPHGTIFGMLHTDFRVPRYQELYESDWYRIEQWFRIQFPGQKLPEAPAQGELFNL